MIDMQHLLYIYTYYTYSANTKQIFENQFQIVVSI